MTSARKTILPAASASARLWYVRYGARKGTSLTRQHFDDQLRALTVATITLGEQAALAVEQAVQAFTHFDQELAGKVIEEDESINHMERQILDDSALLLTLQAPVASDLRRVLGVSRIVADLEAVGDHAAAIAEAALRLAAPPATGTQGDLAQIISQVQVMIREGMRSFAENDTDLARAVCTIDDGVDGTYALLFRELLGDMVEDVSLIARFTYTLFVARDLERIADHMSNVAETVIYIVTGETAELN